MSRTSLRIVERSHPIRANTFRASTATSRFLSPIPGLPADRIKIGAPAPQRPSAVEIAAYPSQAAELVSSNDQAQYRTRLQQIKAGPYHLDWLQGKHVLIAGGTGEGLGCAVATAVMSRVGKSGSLTVLSRDLNERSLGFFTGKELGRIAAEKQIKFRWINDGVALDVEEERPEFEKICAALGEAGAQDIIYINTVAAAYSGLTVGLPPIYVSDLDAEGNLFQWQLRELKPKEEERTKYFMGTQAIAFPDALRRRGFTVAQENYADWRGSLDRVSRDPSKPEYGRQGAYSTSLYLPKDIIHEYVIAAYRDGRRGVLDHFFPTMRTRALPFIPGGVPLANLYENLLGRLGIPHIGVPELALQMIDRMGRALDNPELSDPFPRHDLHEAKADGWFEQIMTNLNLDPASPHFYRKWIA